MYNEKLVDSELRVKDADSHHTPLHQQQTSLLSIPDDDMPTPSFEIENTHYSYTIEELEALGTAFLACEAHHAKIAYNHPFTVAQRPRLIALRLHVTTVFPEFFKEFQLKSKKSDSSSIENKNSIISAESNKVFALVLLYKQIQSKIAQDEEKAQRMSEYASSSTRNSQKIVNGGNNSSRVRETNNNPVISVSGS